MADKIETIPARESETETPTVTSGTGNPGTSPTKKVERIANRAAHKAAETVHKYDKEHTIFSK